MFPLRCHGAFQDGNEPGEVSVEMREVNAAVCERVVELSFELRGGLSHDGSGLVGEGDEDASPMVGVRVRGDKT